MNAILIDKDAQAATKYGDHLVAHPAIHKMCLDHFNEPVLFGFEVARIIGYGEDDEDCYLITRYTNGWHRISLTRDGIVWHSAVGGYIFLDGLKGQNPVMTNNPKFDGEIWDDYTRLDRLLSMNGCPREEKFILELKRKT